MTADRCYVDPVNNRWYSAKTGQLFPVDPPPPPTLELGPVLYSVAEINAWPGSGAAYTAFAGSTYGNVSRSVTDWGTGGPTTNANNDTVIDQSVHAVCQAILWAADGTTARRNKVIEFLDGLKDITVISGSGAQARLDWSWIVCNIAKAAWIIGYESEAGWNQLKSMLLNVAKPQLDWYTAANWHASMSAARIMMASLIKDEDEWADAVAYFEWHIPRGIYHSAYDGANIVPIRAGTRNGVDWLWDSVTNPKTSAPISNNATEEHWNLIINNMPTTTATYVGTGFPGGQFADGTDGEAARDLGHEQFTLVGYAYCALTMERVGYAINPASLERIRAMAQWHGGRVFSYLDDGTLDAPAGDDPRAAAGDTIEWGWNSVARLFSTEVPSNVTACLGHTDVQTTGWSGYQHITGDRFGDGILVAA